MQPLGSPAGMFLSPGNAQHALGLQGGVYISGQAEPTANTDLKMRDISLVLVVDFPHQETIYMLIKRPDLFKGQTSAHLRHSLGHKSLSLNPRKCAQVYSCSVEKRFYFLRVPSIHL